MKRSTTVKNVLSTRSKIVDKPVALIENRKLDSKIEYGLHSSFLLIASIKLIKMLIKTVDNHPEPIPPNPTMAWHHREKEKKKAEKQKWITSEKTTTTTTTRDSREM